MKRARTTQVPTNEPGLNLRFVGAVVFCAALAVRLLHVWAMRDSIFFAVLLGDSRGYDAWAATIAAGDWFGGEVFYQAPLYPYFLGLLYSLFGDDLFAVRVVQAIIGAAGAVAMTVAATRLFSPRAGLAAGLMLALYPPAIFFDALIQKSVLDVALVAIAIALVATVIRCGDSDARWVTVGVTLGALALTRENALLLAAVVLVWASRRGLRASAALVIGLALLLVPVAARNYIVGGGVYLTTSQLGSNLFIGNNARADGSYMALREGRGSPEFERVDATELAQSALGRPLTPAEVSRYWMTRAFDYVRAQPLDWLALTGCKLWLLVNGTEVIDTESQESHAEYSWPLRTLGAAWGFGLLLPLAVVGVMLTWSERRTLSPLYALIAAYAISVVAFYVVARYRLPLVPMLIPFAAAAVAHYRRARAGAIVVFALVLAVANWPLYSAPSQQAITENNLGTALQEAGRLDDAISHYRRALTLDPRFTPAVANLGAALRAAGRTDDALALYDRAIAAGEANASVHINRGNALMHQGRLEEAVRAFRHAHAADPESEEARRSLANALYDLGTAALEAGAFAPAEAALREALSFTRDHASAHNNLGIALASQGRLPEAVAAWEAALRADPTFTDARRNLERAR